MPLQSRFLAQLDFISESLLRVFAKQLGEQAQKLKDMTAMMTVKTFKLFNYKVYMHHISSVKDLYAASIAKVNFYLRVLILLKGPHNLHHAITVPA